MVVGMLFFSSRQDNDETCNQTSMSSNYEAEVVMTTEPPNEVLLETDPTVSAENAVDVTGYLQTINLDIK